MRKIGFIFLFFSQFSIGQSSVENAQNLFDIANEMYQKGDYENAIQKYEFIEKNFNFESSELYFNLGNCYYKTKKTAPSIYYFEKALLLNPNDETILTNLEIAQKRIQNNPKKIQKSSFFRFLESFSTLVSVNSWAILSLIFSFFILILFLLKNQFQKQSSIGIRICVLIVLIAIGAAYYQENYLKPENIAIVFNSKTSLKMDSNEKAEEIMSVYEGTKVFVMETQNNWKRVKLTDKTEGWISSDAVKNLD